LSGPRLAVLGPGRVGTTLARALEAAGYRIEGLVDRHEDRAAISRADIVLITVPDDVIEEAFASLVRGGLLAARQVVLHCSGLVTSAALVADEFEPAGRAALHPMMAFADVDRALEALPGTTYGVEGDERGIQVARRLVGDLGGRVVIVPAPAKAAYHLACVMASNGLVALTDEAVEITRASGIEGDDLASGLANLVMGTAGNMARLGIRPAMTGPVVRGDVSTVATHLEILGRGRPEIAEAYRLLMRRLVAMAIESGQGDRERYEKILELIGD
jgi:predicted short-subunit dehydrogenase-like oxidoreductase (DUF2520 family)